MKSLSDSEDAITGINVTPLVDIILVVLIIFMATAPLIHKRAINVDVPASSHNDTADVEALEIIYNAKRELYISGRKVDREELKNTLMSVRNSNPNIRIMLSGDKSVSYGEMVDVLDVIRETGVRKASLEVRVR